MRGLHEALYIGYMVNTLLPLRAGEVVRAFAGRRDRATRTRARPWRPSFIEKVLDLGTIALLLFLLGLIFPDLPDSARYAAYLSGIGLAIAWPASCSCWRRAGLATRLALWFEKRVPPLAKIGVAGLLNAFLDGLAFARNPVTLAWVVLLVDRPVERCRRRRWRSRCWRSGSPARRRTSCSR